MIEFAFVLVMLVTLPGFLVAGGTGQNKLAVWCGIVIFASYVVFAWLGCNVFLMVFMGLVTFYVMAHAVGFVGGSLLGWILGRLIYNPADNLKPEKENSIAQGHVKFGRYDEAIAEYERALADDPKDIQPMWELATIYAYNLKDYEHAAGGWKKLWLTKNM